MKSKTFRSLMMCKNDQSMPNVRSKNDFKKVCRSECSFLIYIHEVKVTITTKKQAYPYPHQKPPLVMFTH